MPKSPMYNYESPYSKTTEYGKSGPGTGAVYSPTMGDSRYRTMEVTSTMFMDDGHAETRGSGKTHKQGGMGGGKY